MEKKWIIQLVFGLLLIGIFLYLRLFVVEFSNHPQFNMGFLVGMEVSCFFWGIREIFGALRSQYKFLIKEK